MSKKILQQCFVSLLVPFSVSCVLMQNQFGYLMGGISLIFLGILLKTTHIVSEILENEIHLSEKNIQLASEVKNTMSQLITSAKKTSIGQFAGYMAHEINNPLAYIQASLSFMKLKSSYNVTETNAKIDKIELHIERIKQIIKSISYLSTQSLNNKRTIENLEQLVSKSLEVKSTVISDLKIQVITKIPKELYLECHAFDFSLLLINLISNSIEAIEQQEERWILIEAINHSEQRINLKITDNGPGIDPRYQNKILEPFFTSKKSTNAQGLGLTIAKSIVDAHHGDLYLDSQTKNTTFIVSVPKRLSEIIENTKQAS